mgnify:CR=1 FL=1
MRSLAPPSSGGIAVAQILGTLEKLEQRDSRTALAALKQRVADSSGVNVDQEMANLITLQTVYGANARVMSTVKDMIESFGVPHTEVDLVVVNGENAAGGFGITAILEDRRLPVLRRRTEGTRARQQFGGAVEVAEVG